MTRPGAWLHETLHPGYGQAFEVSRVLYEGATGFQGLKLIETPRFGRLLMLDGAVQTTTADEFIYHEMMAHVPMLAHGAVRRALIIGGGDGGLAREALRHKELEKLTMVEIDAGVVDFSRRHLPGLSAGAFDDPRLELVIADGDAWMRAPGERFDVIFVDSCDPVGPAEVLFSEGFYGAARARLAPGGLLVAQLGAPFFQPDELRHAMRAFRALFPDWGCYLAPVPSYAGGVMAVGWAAMDGRARATPGDELARRWRAAGLEGVTRHYAPDVHQASFAAPPWIKRLLEG